jgi:GNAT superfamily N-acetyltransferase
VKQCWSLKVLKMKIAYANTDEEIAACYPVMRQLRPHLDAAAFLAAAKRMRAEGYFLVFLADPDVRAVAGFRRMEMLAMGTVLYVDDLVTCEKHRSRGYGRHFLAWLLDEAKRRHCQYLELDSGMKRLDAHRFYERNGFGKVAFHFSVPAEASKAWTSGGDKTT